MLSRLLISKHPSFPHSCTTCLAAASSVGTGSHPCCSSLTWRSDTTRDCWLDPGAQVPVFRIILLINTSQEREPGSSTTRTRIPRFRSEGLNHRKRAQCLTWANPEPSFAGTVVANIPFNESGSGALTFRRLLLQSGQPACLTESKASTKI